MQGQSEAAWERAMKGLGIEMIPAYSPQARGRSERRFGTRAGWPWNSTCLRKQMKAKGSSLADPQGIDAEGDAVEGSQVQEGKPRQRLPG